MSKKMAKQLHEEFKMACFATTFLLSLCVANSSQAANPYDVCNKYTDMQFRDCKDQVRQQEQQQAKQQAEARRQQQAQQRAQQEQQDQAKQRAQQRAQGQAQEKAQQKPRSLQESQQTTQALEKAKSQLDVLQKDLAQKQAQEKAQQRAQDQAQEKAQQRAKQEQQQEQQQAKQQRQQQAEAQKSQQQKNNLNIQGNFYPNGGAAISTSTYQYVLTPQELAWSNSLPYVYRATTQFSPEQITQIKHDGRWEPWVAQTKTEVAGQNKSVSASQKPIGTQPSSLPPQETAPSKTLQTKIEADERIRLQARIEANERIIGDLPDGGMKQAARVSQDQAKRELQAGKLEDSQKSLLESNKFGLLASNSAVDSANIMDPSSPKDIFLYPEYLFKHKAEDLPRYGNFGGKGYTGGYDGKQLPINRMDELFQAHDSAYRAAKNEDAVLQADRALVAGLKLIDENNIIILKDGSKGNPYGTITDDIAYRDNAIRLFKLKIIPPILPGTQHTGIVR